MRQAGIDGDGRFLERAGVSFVVLTEVLEELRGAFLQSPRAFILGSLPHLGDRVPVLPVRQHAGPRGLATAEPAAEVRAHSPAGAHAPVGLGFPYWRWVEPELECALPLKLYLRRDDVENQVDGVVLTLNTDRGRLCALRPPLVVRREPGHPAFHAAEHEVRDEGATLSLVE